MNDNPQPPLKPLHPETSLSPAKLAMFEKVPTEKLKESLAPGQDHCLKTKPDGTMLDGHHRVHILRGRAEDVDALPREVIEPTLEHSDYEARRAAHFKKANERKMGRRQEHKPER